MKIYQVIRGHFFTFMVHQLHQTRVRKLPLELTTRIITLPILTTPKNASLVNVEMFEDMVDFN